MKNKIIVPIAIFAAFLFASCTKAGQGNEVVSTDMTKPQPVSNVSVQNVNGGAVITYTLPRTQNTLYVQADYTINDKTGAVRQTKSSYYSDTTVVEGFAESKDYEVELKVVTRAGVASDPVKVTVHPDTPPYLLVRQTLSLSPDFSGVAAAAENPLKKNIGVVMIYNDPGFGKYIIREQRYSNFEEIKYSTRGLDTLPKLMGAYVADAFGNVSDTLFETIEPLYEVPLDRNRFFDYTLPTDKPPYQPSYGVFKLYNGIVAQEDCWHTAILQGADNTFPYTCTFGIGLKAKLSRFTIWDRPFPGRYWGGENAKVFSIWGSDKDQPADRALLPGQPEGTVMGDWVNLGNYRFPDPPSGNQASPGTVTSADIAFWNAGIEFNIPISAIPVKYIRFALEQNWGGSNYGAVSELRFYGDPRLR
ncbi:DUF4959 domain-containing protein [Niabella hirudinis]|uniref:DUF4959 domain-containing protein n=1 Tax=Niabella hirudinis TaxID=1285929 RepID=UPI003EB69A41